MSTTPYERFYHGFYDVKGMKHEIEIYKTEEVAPFNIKYNSRNSVKLSHQGGLKNEWDKTTIQGQEFTFTFLLARQYMDVIDTIFESEYKDFKVKYTLNETEVKFIGFIKPENLYRTFEKNNPFNEVTISATDCLADLKDIEFKTLDPVTPQVFTGRKTLLNIIKLALDQIGLSLDFKVQLNMWETTGMISTECALLKIWVNSERFWTREDGDTDYKVMNCWDVLDMVLSRYKCKLKQVNGFYVITNPYEINSYEFLIDYDTLAQISRTAKFNTWDLSEWKFFPNIEQQKVHPLKSILTVFKTVDTGGDVTGVDLTDWINSWTINFYSHSVSVDGKTLQMTSINGKDSNDYIELKNKFSVSKISDNDYIRILFDYRVESLTHPGGIPEMVIKIQVQRPNNVWSPAIDVPLYQTDSDTWIKFDSNQFDIFKIVEAGTYNIRISFMAYPNYNWDWTTASFKIRNVYVPKFKDWQQDAYDKTSSNYDQQFSQLNVKGFEQLKEEVQLGDGSQVTENSTLLTFVGGQYDVTSNWNSYGGSESCSIIDLTTRLVLMNRSRYKDFLRCTIIDQEHVLNLDNIIILNGLYYTFNSFSKSAQTGDVEAELVELIVGDTAEAYEPQQELQLKSATFGGSATPVAAPQGVIQVAHGFEKGDVISFEKNAEDDGGVFALAILGSSLQPIGLVSDIISDDIFRYTNDLYFSDEVFEFEVGKNYYLSTDPGKLTDTSTLFEEGVEQCIGFGTHQGFKVEIDSRVVMQTHIELAKLTPITDRAVSVTFSKPFAAVPVGRLKVYRMKQASVGKWKEWDVLYYHTVENWLTTTGFSLQIETTENLTGIIIDYEFKEIGL